MNPTTPTPSTFDGKFGYSTRADIIKKISSVEILKRSLGDTVRALGWYQQFGKIVLMFAITNIEHCVSPCDRDLAPIQHSTLFWE